MALAQRQVQFAPARADGSGAPSLIDGYYLIQPTSEYYNPGTGEVKKIKLQVQIDNAPETVDLDVTPVDFSWAWEVTGHFNGQVEDTVDYIQVPAGTYATVLHYGNKAEVPRVDGDTLGPVDSAPSALELRIEALEATPPGSAAGVSSFHGRTGAVTATTADIGDMTATGISLATAASPTAGRTTLSAAAATHTHVATTDLTATGTKNATTFLRGDNTWSAPTGVVAGSVAWTDITGKPSTFPPTTPIAQADVTGLTTLASTVATHTSQIAAFNGASIVVNATDPDILDVTI